MWEYKTIVLPLSTKRGIDESDEVLNAAGAEGWDLVAVVNPKASGGQSDCLAFLKRLRTA